MIKYTEVERIPIPEGVTVKLEGFTCTVKGKLGEISRSFRSNIVRVDLENKEITISASKQNKNSKAIAGTWTSLIRNMTHGVTNGYEYEMKVDYTHFPIRVSVKGKHVVIENFLGERSAREAEILGGCQVSVKGDRITINGIDREQIGNTASNIERATKIKGFDLRVFQDGIYLLGGN